MAFASTALPSLCVGRTPTPKPCPLPPPTHPPPQVLEILSEAKDPLKVQPFVKKCFEAVKEFTFEHNGEVSGMVSVEGEKIPWIETVNPSATGALACVRACVRAHVHTAGVGKQAVHVYMRTRVQSWRCMHTWSSCGPSSIQAG